MINTKAYATVYLEITKELESQERLAWAVLLGEIKIQRKLLQIIQYSAEKNFFKDLTIPKSIAQFMKVIIKDNQITNLAVISQQILAKAYEQKIGIVIKIIVKNKPSQEFIDRITDQLSQNHGMPALINIETDADLIGGVKIKLASQLIDLSFNNRLSNLKYCLSA